MIRHWIKLMWNKKRQNGLMMLEIGFSFLILFCAFSIAIYYYGILNTPQGFEHENVWVVEFTGAEFKNFKPIKESIYRELEAFPDIIDASFTTPNFPFSGGSWQTNLGKDYTDIQTEYMRVDPTYGMTLNMEMKEGRWFDETDKVNKYKSVVINQAFKEAVFGDENALGEVFYSGKVEYKVVGVTGNFKFSDPYKVSEPCYLMPLEDDFKYSQALLFQVNPNITAETEKEIVSMLQATAKGFDINLRYLKDRYDYVAKKTSIPLIVLFIICGFLVFNVALGLFGVLWYNINQRQSEIGLRRAMGATGFGISYQFVGEMLILASFGILIGSFFTLQFPLMKVFDLDSSIYFLAMLLSILTIGILVVMCAWQPSREAALVQPAIVLHEE